MADGGSEIIFIAIIIADGAKIRPYCEETKPQILPSR